MTFLDGLASLPQLSSYSPDALRKVKDEALSKLDQLVPLQIHEINDTSIFHSPVHIQIGSFILPKGPEISEEQSFNFEAPTSRDNAMRVVRACQVPKPILLEGSPGVGKTSLITALANVAGHTLRRINLSDQTDLIDLFGADLPVEGGAPGEFAWKDAEFLRALQEGHWVLLDEMNLAPQAVLEGLNAVLDHRGTVYLPELGRSFTRHPSFRIFAAQNPLNQGGGRKGLPKSFVNRFTKVYVEELSPDDLTLVCQHLFPDIREGVIRAMIAFNMRLNEEIVIRRRFAREGSPWEFNLRDVMRWGTLLRQSPSLTPADYLNTIYLHRFRSQADRDEAERIFEDVFTVTAEHCQQNPRWLISTGSFQVGNFIHDRGSEIPLHRTPRILKHQLAALESVGYCISHSWLSILTGPQNSGKSSVVRALANLTGTYLHEISVHSATDTMDILGSFEQLDLRGQVATASSELLASLNDALRTRLGSERLREDGLRLQKALQGRTQSGSNQGLLLLAKDVLSHLGFTSSAGDALRSKIEVLLNVSNAAGRFEWVDGPLIQAMKNGHWLLLDGANLCNPSVLDRLNSLCEPNGVLVLSERGYVDGAVPMIKPHPRFRLFMTVDPHFGELSRAMRNRGIEIALTHLPIADDVETMLDCCRLPAAPLSGSMSNTLLQFEHIRRGLVRLDFHVTDRLLSTGRALDTETQLGPLLDSSPMVISEAQVISNSHLYFLGQTLSMASIPVLRRFFHSRSHKSNDVSRVQNLLHRYSSDLLSSAAEYWATLCGLSLERVKDQVSKIVPTRRAHPYLMYNHTCVFEILNKAVQLHSECANSYHQPES